MNLRIVDFRIANNNCAPHVTIRKKHSLSNHVIYYRLENRALPALSLQHHISLTCEGQIDK